MITLLDYGAGNVRSVVNAIETLGETVKIVTDPEDILSAEKLVFPGVGAFGSMIRILHKKKYVEPLKAYINSNRPFLGICLGLQVLFDSSEEAPNLSGLGLIAGTVRRFNTALSVPHIGWNGLNFKQPSRVFTGLNGNEKFYFVHSFHVDVEDEAVILTTTDYGYEFVSSIQKGNIIASQFHPEKSGRTGLRILQNFLEFAGEPIQPVQTSTRDQGDLVVTKGDQYDVREDGDVRNLGKPVEMARRYYQEGADEITFLNITGFRDFPLEDMPMLEVLRQTSQKVFVPLTIGGGIRDYTDKDGRKYRAQPACLRIRR